MSPTTSVWRMNRGERLTLTTQRASSARARVRPPPGPAARLAQHEAVDRNDQARLLGERNEPRRARAGRASGASSAASASVATTSPVSSDDLGLEVHDELAVLERAPQVALELEPLHRRAARTSGRTAPNAPRPFSFATYIARSAWRSRSRGRVRCRRATARRRRWPRRTARGRRLEQRPRMTSTIRSAMRSATSGSARLVEQHRELVAAEARDDVARPEARREALGDRDEHAVADLVTEAVVHELEPVDVEEQHRDVAVVVATRSSCACSSRSRNNQRFGRRVSASWCAWNVSCSCARPPLGDVAHVADETRPPRGRRAGW